MPRFFILLFIALAANGQEQKRVAILNTEDNGEPELEYTDLLYLTDRLREIALKTLPENKYFVMTTQSIIDKLGTRDNARKVCKEAQCLAEIGRKVSADYVGQARLGRFGGNFTISMELYHSAGGNLIGSFTGNAKDVFGLLDIINENAPSMFSGMPSSKAQPASVAVSAPIPAPAALSLSPSFDCAKASTPSEKAICSNADLAELDNRLAKAYSKARLTCEKDVKKEQREWLKDMSSCSSNIQCLKNSYTSRIQELENCW